MVVAAVVTRCVAVVMVVKEVYEAEDVEEAVDGFRQ